MSPSGQRGHKPRQPRTHGGTMNEEHRVLEALRTTIDTLQATTAVVAAGQPAPTALHELLIGWHWAVIEALAVLQDSTPRTIASEWFEKMPADEEWSAVLEQRAARGRQILGVDEEGDTH